LKRHGFDLLIFSCKRQETRRARPHARARNEKPGAACRPGSWRSFGEYAFLEDSRYTSQAENRAAIKSLNQHRKSALPVGRNIRSALRQSMPCRIDRRLEFTCRVASDWVHVFTIRNRKVTKFREFNDTAQFAQAYRG
jgi:hypothetical protein